MPVKVGPLTIPVFEWPFPFIVFPVVIVFACSVITCSVSRVTATGPALASESIVDTCSGAVLVTLGWIFVYGTMLGAQAGHAGVFLCGIKEPTDVTISQFTQIPARVVGNTLEQAPIFLASFWLYVLFVDAATGSAMGWVYVASRFAYAFLYFGPGEFTILIEFSTQVG